MSAEPKDLVLVVEDQDDERRTIERVLKRGGYRVTGFGSGESALKAMSCDEPALLITDLALPGMDGLALLESMKERHPLTEVVLLTGQGSEETAVTAMKAGAYDYLVKPVERHDFVRLADRALDRRRLAVENERLRRDLGAVEAFSRVVGTSNAILSILDLARQVAPSTATVLITGESGTGKEVIARTLHAYSPRHAGPFVKVSCAALPETLLEAELFGHEQGAFTGANYRRVGRFESANGGTIFLDEVGDIPLAVQVKLLRVLQERQFERIGGNETIRSDVRVVAATNADLEQLITERQFRQDLYYRLKVVEIRLPPLRSRRDDIPVLAHHFLRRFAAENSRAIRDISRRALSILLAHDWPGNVRELENTIERAVVLARGDEILPEDLPPALRGTAAAEYVPEDRPAYVIPFGTPMDEVERILIQRTLDHLKGDKEATARALGIGTRTVYRKLAESGPRGPRRSDPGSDA